MQFIRFFGHIFFISLPTLRSLKSNATAVLGKFEWIKKNKEYIHPRQVKESSTICPTGMNRPVEFTLCISRQIFPLRKFGT